MGSVAVPEGVLRHHAAFNNNGNRWRPNAYRRRRDISKMFVKPMIKKHFFPIMSAGRGVYKGRKPSIDAIEVFRLRREEGLGPTAIARRLGIDRKFKIYRQLKCKVAYSTQQNSRRPLRQAWLFGDGERRGRNGSLGARCDQRLRRRPSDSDHRRTFRVRSGRSRLGSAYQGRQFMAFRLQSRRTPRLRVGSRDLDRASIPEHTHIASLGYTHTGISWKRPYSLGAKRTAFSLLVDSRERCPRLAQNTCLAAVKLLWAF